MIAVLRVKENCRAAEGQEIGKYPVADCGFSWDRTNRKSPPVFLGGLDEVVRFFPDPNLPANAHLNGVRLDREVTVYRVDPDEAQDIGFKPGFYGKRA